MQIYLSHSDHDKKFAAKLRKELARAGQTVWDPDTEVFPGSNWLMITGGAMADSDAIVFILSNEALRSPWIIREVEYALGTLKFRNRVVSVLLDSGAEIPWILDHLPLIKPESESDVAAIARKIVAHLEKPLKIPTITFQQPTIKKMSLRLSKAPKYTAKVKRGQGAAAKNVVSSRTSKTKPEAS